MPDQLEQRSLPSFLALLGGWNVDDLESNRSLIVGTWSDGTIGYFNPAWVGAAERRGAGPGFWERWGAGANIHDAGGGPGPATAHGGTPITGEDTGGGVREFYYHCDGPEPGDEHLYCVRSFPITPRREAAIIVHSEVAPLVTNPGQPVPSLPREAFAGVGGLVLQCSHCRRLRRAGNPEHWVEARGTLRELGPISHGLCPVCFNLFATLP